MIKKSILQSLEYKKYEVDENLSYFKPHVSKKTKTFAEEVTQSLSKTPKSINPKFFYDKRGSELFDQICKLPEYYLTRTEIGLLNKIRHDFGDFTASDFRLVELGSGSSIKTRLILDILKENQSQLEYIPIDISEILEQSSKLLLQDYDNLSITGIIDSYCGGLEFLQNYDAKPNLIAFLGSSFGNFDETEGRSFLKKINSLMKGSDLFLIGLDLVKDKKILERAYDDSKGITAKFNLNVLSRMNLELLADFNLENFSHMALYNGNKNRIEMYLKSKVKQDVKIRHANLEVSFEKDELIHTENSHKYSGESINKLFKETNFKIKNTWTDSEFEYSLVLAQKNN